MIITKQFFFKHFPLNPQGRQSYLSWTIGLLSIVMVFILTAFFAIYRPYADSQSKPSFTIKIPLVNKNETFSPIPLNKVIDLLKTIPSLQKIEIVKKTQLLRLLEPSVNSSAPFQDLELPTFIDVTLNNKPSLDIKFLTHQLRQIKASIQVDPYSQEQSVVQNYHYTFKSMAFISVGLIMVIMILLVSLATKTALMAYHPIVDSLRLMGAKNGFIARHFQRHTFTSCLKGSFWGTVVALMIIYGQSLVLQLLGIDKVQGLLLEFQNLPFFLLLPFITALISIIASRLSVSRLLRRLDP